MEYNPSNVDLLIVDDDADFRGTVVRRCRRRGFHVREAASGEEALELCARRQFDVVLLDMVMPGMSGLKFLEQLKAANVESEVIMLTGQGTVETAVAAMKLGAFDFITKPFPLAELEVLIEKAYDRGQLAKENRQLKLLLERSRPQWEIVGESPAVQHVFRLIDRAGPTDKAILIQGESGTGKELVARALHSSSPRAEKPLVVVNCATVSESLLESELFGHEKGAFTGAFAAKPGLFEVADGGTLLIDEIGEMPSAMQAKLLRVLEDGSLRRVGSLRERRVNVRLLSSTNRSIREEVAAGRFREDLYYRINVMTLELPPLRERTGDVPLLVSHFLGPDWQIEERALRAMTQYDWPGNVRQLINAVERGRILADDQTIRLRDLPPEIVETVAANSSAINNDGDHLADVARAKIIEVLDRERGNKARTARVLGITRRSLYRLLEKHHITTTGKQESSGTSADSPSKQHEQ